MFGLINRIDFGRAVEDTNLFHIRKEISDDLRLLIQWCQIVGPCNIDACTAVVIQFNDFLDSMAVAVRSGNVEYGAVKFALDDLKLSYSEESDIVREVSYIVFQYEKGGVKLTDLFQDLADRSGLEDIRNFAMVYSVIEGRSDRFGEVLMSTRDIISNKIEIESQIDATITSAKNETNTMLIMPIIIVVFMATIGKGMMDSLFTTLAGNLAATVALIIFGISYVLSVRAARIDL